MQTQTIESQPKVRVLLAEDYEPHIFVFSNYLEEKGYEVIVAHDGAEAIEMAEKWFPHIILMDIKMPVMNGFEAIQMIRNSETLNALPIIAVTASAMPGDREGCLEVGANAYLSKPVSLKKLHAMIEEYRIR